MFKCDLCNKEIKDKYKASDNINNLLQVEHNWITFCDMCVEDSWDLGVKDFQRKLAEREVK